jgi:hypothetical protein
LTALAPARRLGGVMYPRIALLTLVLFAPGCIATPKTTVHVGNTKSLPDTLAILAFVDQATDGRLDKTLVAFQTDLVEKLRTKNRFASVSSAISADTANAEAVVQCKITQFDTGARRIVIVTEVTSRKDGKTLLRMVTSTKFISVVWPIDYASAMNSSRATAVDDIVDALTKSDR